MSVTYRQLLGLLNQMSDTQLDDTAHVLDLENCEYYGIQSIGVASEENGVLDAGHLYLNIKGEEDEAVSPCSIDLNDIGEVDPDAKK